MTVLFEAGRADLTPRRLPPPPARPNVPAVRRPVRTSPIRSAARFALTLVALFAFTVQSIVTQIHVHGAASGDTASITFGKTQPGKLPPGGDQTNCPICQAIMHAGIFTAPVVAVLPLPAFASFAITASVRIAAVTQTSSHSWNSRAPPRF